jgi:hypothetical protein
VRNSLVFVIFLLAILATSFVGQHLRVYAYLLDNANFTEKHCVNKNTPNSKCKGACQIRKMAEDAPADSPTQSPELKAIDLFIETQSVLKQLAPCPSDKKPFCAYRGIPLEKNCTYFPQPPDALS